MSRPTTSARRACCSNPLNTKESSDGGAFGIWPRILNIPMPTAFRQSVPLLKRTYRSGSNALNNVVLPEPTGPMMA